MDQDELETLAIKLRTLERRLNTVVAGCVISLAALVVLTAWVQPVTSQPSVVRARRVEVTDDEGQPRMTLDAVGRRPSLWLYDPSGRKRVGLMVVNPGVPVVWLQDTEERKRLELSVLPDGTSAFIFSDAAGRPRLLLRLGADGDPSLSLAEPLTRPRILLKVLGDETSGFWMFDKTGRIRFSAP